ncbi:DUF935 domain-containing protein [Klebsiella pneumoniae]|uniref:DUF935 domain-containing protein n=2 Tax=Klebsiella pneumoniae complex TaxID=3390273 RepID=UPI0015E66C20|nr:DUF935 domain-containing protein [Klebsiella pneumoniae]MBA1613627.1 DUF935 domain-containing protein [Klebsiella pneumoniae]
MGKIVDQWGRPFDKAVTKAPQTARMIQLNSTYPAHPSRGLTIRRLPRILQEAEQGYLSAQADLFDDMVEKDGHIFSEMAKRKNALLGLDWSIEPRRNATAEEKNLAAMVQEWFDSLDNLEDIILQAADAIGHGFSCQELEWELEENVWLPSAAHLRPHRWFQARPDRGDNIRLNDGSIDGAELMPFGWMVHKHNAKTGFTGQSGLYRVLVWPYLFKNFAVRDLAEFLEIYGLPARVGKYMAGATDQDKDALFEALVTLGHNAAGIIPQGTDIDFKSAASGQADPFVAMMDWCERTQSKVILGATLTSQADGKTSTNALGNVHNDVRHDILVSDAKQLHGFFSSMIDMLLRINGYEISRRRLPKFVFDTRDIEEIASFSTGVKNLVESGVKSIPASWVHKKLGIPVPQKDEAVLEAPSQASALSPVALNQRFRRIAALTTAAELSDPAQEALDNGRPVPEKIAAAMEKLIAPLVAALQDGKLPDEAMDIIAGSYPDLDDSELVTLLKQALFVSDVWGRLNSDA